LGGDGHERDTSSAVAVAAELLERVDRGELVRAGDFARLAEEAIADPAEPEPSRRNAYSENSRL
jgi:hypothetical protein